MLSPKQKILGTVTIAIAVLVALFFALNSYIYSEKQGDDLPADFKEILFTMSGEPVSLAGGVGQVTTTLGGGGMSTVRYFGNEVTQDVDGNGTEDAVFLVTQETADGSVFFYAVAALKSDGGYTGSHAVLLGKDIAPQTTEKGEGRSVVVNYAIAGDPSAGKSIRLLLDPVTLELGEVVQDFEGESR